VATIPNWVNVGMTISREVKELKRFRDFAESDMTMSGKPYTDDKGNKCFYVIASHNFIPYPEKYAKYDREPKTEVVIERGTPNGKPSRRKKTFRYTDGFNMGGYEWCDKHWGSKWGICDAYLDHEDYTKGEAHLVYTFQSPWSFPTPLLVKMSKMFPKLEFSCEMDEESFEFIGEMIFKAGKITYDDTHKPSCAELVEAGLLDEEQAEEYYGKDWRKK